jgi:hypothetical protein
MFNPVQLPSWRCECEPLQRLYQHLCCLCNGRFPDSFIGGLCSLAAEMRSGNNLKLTLMELQLVANQPSEIICVDDRRTLYNLAEDVLQQGNKNASQPAGHSDHPVSYSAPSAIATTFVPPRRNVTKLHTHATQHMQHTQSMHNMKSKQSTRQTDFPNNVDAMLAAFTIHTGVSKLPPLPSLPEEDVVLSRKRRCTDDTNTRFLKILVK